MTLSALQELFKEFKDEGRCSGGSKPVRVGRQVPRIGLTRVASNGN